MHASHGRPPTIEELAKKTGLSEEKLTLIAGYTNMRAPASLDTPLKTDGDSTLLDILASPSDVSLDEQLDSARWSEGVAGLLSVLTPIEASVVRLEEQRAAQARAAFAPPASPRARFAPPSRARLPEPAQSRRSVARPGALSCRCVAAAQTLRARRAHRQSLRSDAVSEGSVIS